MSAFEVTTAEELTKSGTLRGRLADVSLPEMLIFLKLSEKTGVLTIVQTGVRKAIYFMDGRVVFAASSLSQDRLGEVLLRGGKISADEYLRLSQRIRGGQRLGKALIESGVLAPGGGLIRDSGAFSGGCSRRGAAGERSPVLLVLGSLLAVWGSISLLLDPANLRVACVKEPGSPAELSIVA